MANSVIKNVTLSNGSKADLNAKYWNENETLKTINSESIFGSGDIKTQICIRYDELKKKRNNKTLIPGQQYRITDYVTTTTQAGTESAGHQFDIIVTALNEYTLSEEAHAIQNQTYDYFDGCNLSAWKIWYCIDNDTNRFGWAYEYGKGVIYRMIDEWGNDCPYDFKNIMFEREIYSFDNGCGVTPIDGGCDITTFCYTFSWEESENVIVDASIFGNGNDGLTDENGDVVGVYENKIGVHNVYGTRHLNNNVLFSSYGYDQGYFKGYCRNIFGEHCCDNSFNDGFINNRFGNNCLYNYSYERLYNNTFGDECCGNRFWGDYVTQSVGNTFGNNSSDNNFYGDCYNNTFGNDCSENDLMYGCENNIFGNNCCLNQLESYCYSNVFGINCESNNMSDECCYNSFGNGCSEIKFGERCCYNSFGNGCYCIDFTQPNGFIPYLNNTHFGDRVVNVGLSISIFGESLDLNYNLRNVNVTQGFNSSSSNEEYVEINMDEYVGISDTEITIAKDMSGSVVVFCLSDILQRISNELGGIYPFKILNI